MLKSLLVVAVVSFLFLTGCEKMNLSPDGKVMPYEYPIKVMYREAGKTYTQSDEQSAGYPFEEAIVQPGEVWTLPKNATFLKMVELRNGQRAARAHALRPEND